ncbi:hypothetical protein OIE68_39550 [Nocardia vinacea]|uniref:hypothetical protein n=1 Tax=Nocardia vinacea TaxID=96468 RepID=UPI002E1585CE|nr:hypothetical protein OIE68_39550 [Nocardia vinacea]
MSEADPAEIETELEIVIDIEIDLAELNDDEREDLDRLHKGALEFFIEDGIRKIQDSGEI